MEWMPPPDGIECQSDVSTRLLQRRSHSWAELAQSVWIWQNGFFKYTELAPREVPCSARSSHGRSCLRSWSAASLHFRRGRMGERRFVGRAIRELGHDISLTPWNGAATAKLSGAASAKTGSAGTAGVTPLHNRVVRKGW